MSNLLFHPHRLLSSGRSLLTAVSVLLSVASCLLMASCSDWDTDSIGSKFIPANSQVRNFTHLVYVEYDASSARVWGPYAHEVNATVDGLNVAIECNADSLVLLAYGYPASQDSTAQSDGSLHISSTRPYALYLNGLALRSQSGAVLTSNYSCQLVLPTKTQNHLFGSIEVTGDLLLSGTGTLNVRSEESCISADSLHCQYGVTVNLTSSKGNGITVRKGEMRSSQGKWRIDALRHGIAATDSIQLIAGTYRGTALQGAFLSTGLTDKVRLRQANLLAASGQDNTLADVFTQQHDSAFSVYDMLHDTLTLMADSTYYVVRNDSSKHFAQFSTPVSLSHPYIIITDGRVMATDSIDFRLTRP